MSGFCRSGPKIHDDIKKESASGVNGVRVAPPSYTLSDATVMNLATAEALVDTTTNTATDPSCGPEDVTAVIAQRYVDTMKDTAERSLGHTTTQSLWQLARDCSNWKSHPYHPREGGCNPAVRATVIGLLLPCEEDLPELVRLAVESCWITHHHPTAFLGAATAASFTAFAIRGLPVREWGHEMMTTVVPLVEQLFEQVPELAHEANNTREMHAFVQKWTAFLELRELPRPGVPVDRGTYLRAAPKPVYPEGFDELARDKYYTSLSFSGWGGASGDDCTIIAYDALVGGCAWEEVCSRGMMHGGDSASTGALAGAWYGAAEGFHGVPVCHYEAVEYSDRLSQCAAALLKCAARRTRK